VTHADAPLTPEGRRRLAVLVVDGAVVAAAGGGTVPVLAGDGEAVGRPVSGRAGADGPQLEAGLVAEPAAAQDRAADRRVAVHPPVGVRTGSRITCALPAPRSAGCWPGTGCPSS